MKNIKTFLCGVSFLVLLAIVVAGIGSHLPRVSAQVVAGTLNGWGWSDTIGWISFNCATGGPTGNNICATSTYAVNEDGSGNLTGYAWSDNIGWIQFGGLTGFPNTTYGTNAKINLSTGNLTGWAQASAGAGRTDGWDGWISLSGVSADSGVYGLNANPSSGLFSGYGWGSDVVGWLTFNTSGSASATPPPICDPSQGQVCATPSGLVPSVTISISPSLVATGTTAVLSWSATNIDTQQTCFINDNGVRTHSVFSSFLPIGQYTIKGYATTAGSPHQFVMTCSASSTDALVTSNTVTLTVATNSPSQPNSCPAIQNATYCDGSGSTSGIISSCRVGTNPTTMCEFSCVTGFRQLGKTCVLNSTVQEN